MGNKKNHLLYSDLWPLAIPKRGGKAKDQSKGDDSPINDYSFSRFFGSPKPHE
jgi:hypothetical protein